MAHRVRFQIHLSTAVVMMFAAGALIWINADAGTKVVGGGFSRRESYSMVAKKYGWPIEFGWGNLRRIKVPFDALDIEVPPDDSISWNAAAIDITLGLILLIAVGVVSERLIRRRAARKVV